MSKERKAAPPTLDCITAMRALADEQRLKIMDTLLAGPQNASALAAAAGLTAYNASRHLAVLAKAGLVTREKLGQQRIYRLSRACEVHMDKRRRTLSLGCCQFRFDDLLRK